MLSAKVIREKVEAFKNENEIARREDAFASWYLARHCRLTAAEAIARSSDGNYDGGLDAFHIRRGDDGPAVLTLVQAKFTEDETQVRKGLSDLRRGIDVLKAILEVGPTDMADENKVVRNLRRDLSELTENERVGLQISCALIHLIKDQELWLSRPAVHKAKQELMQYLADSRFAGRAGVAFFGPDEMPGDDPVPLPASPIQMRFHGVSNERGSAWIGLGHLGDLVELYEKFGNHLFANNVRMYLANRASQPGSAAHEIRSSLHQICDGRMPPTCFGLIHNGVTIAVPHAEPLGDGRLTLKPSILGVSVLNGCQTVFTAWKFFKSQVAKKGESSTWRQNWDGIQLPMRIITTMDDELIRTVAIGANRQTSIRSSALRAHDQIQLDLAKRFARYHIYYERQEGAYFQMQGFDPHAAAEYFGVIGIDELAQVIAAADRSTHLEYARSRTKIFDHEEVYRKVFRAKNLASTRLLIALFNIWLIRVSCG